MWSGLMPVVALWWWWPADAAAASLSQQGCEYGDKMYPSGSKFMPDACTSCVCPSRGLVAQCTVQDCAPEVHCASYGSDEDTSECCPRCQEYGCRHSDGKLFQPGEVIRNEPCVRCYCPMGGGNPVCDVTSCPMSRCVDPEEVPGVCCPVCPNGPNCQIGLLTLPIGQSVTIEGALCVCETFLDTDGQNRTLARCNKD